MIIYHIVNSQNKFLKPFILVALGLLQSVPESLKQEHMIILSFFSSKPPGCLMKIFSSNSPCNKVVLTSTQTQIMDIQKEVTNQLLLLNKKTSSKIPKSGPASLGMSVLPAHFCGTGQRYRLATSNMPFLPHPSFFSGFYGHKHLHKILYF